MKDKNGYGLGQKFPVLILMVSIHVYFFFKSSRCTLKFMHFIICNNIYDHMDCSPPGSSIHEILQVRILEWVAMPSSRGSSQPRDGRIRVFCSSLFGRWVLHYQCHLGSPNGRLDTRKYRIGELEDKYERLFISAGI